MTAANHIHARSAADALMAPVQLAPGALYALEGPKRVGKTTVRAMVATRLEQMGIRGVVLTKEPTPAFNAAVTEGALTGRDLAAAIAVDRGVHVRDVIGPAIQAGSTVLCDRYILSSLVFQGADGVPAEQVWQLNEDFPLPDLNILITASADAIRERRATRGSITRIESGLDPAQELEDYQRHAEDMLRAGVELLTVNNSSPDDLTYVVDVIVGKLTKAEPSS